MADTEEEEVAVTQVEVEEDTVEEEVRLVPTHTHTRPLTLLQQQPLREHLF